MLILTCEGIALIELWVRGSTKLRREHKAPQGFTLLIFYHLAPTPLCAIE